MFYRPVTARQICDITIIHCHCGGSLKLSVLSFLANTLINSFRRLSGLIKKHVATLLGQP